MTAALPNIDTLLRHQDWVRALARSLVADPSRADDVAQQTMLEAIERPPKDLSKPKGWLATVARNAARALARQDRSRQDREQAVARSVATDDGPADYAQRAAAHKQVVDAVFELPEPYHSVVLLRYFEDLDAHGIAKQLNRPVATVRTQLQRGLERMRQRLDRDFGDRQAWCTALLPLFAKKHAVVSVPILSSVGALAMLKWTVPAIIAIASLFFVMPMLQSVADPAPPSQQAPEVASAEVKAPAPVTPTRTAAPAAEVADDLAPAADVLPVVRGRLLSLQGQALSVTPIEYTGKQWPRFDGTRLVVGDHRDRLTPARLAALRASPAAMADYVKVFQPLHQVTAALLRGEAISPPQTVTDASGRFEFHGPSELHARDLKIGDQTWVVFGSGRVKGDEEQLFLAGASVRVTGRVLHEDGKPAGVGVSFYCPADRLPGFGQKLDQHDDELRRMAITNSDGYFDLGFVPRLDGMQITAIDNDHRSASIETTKVDGPVLLTLRDPKRSARDGLKGTIYNADGSLAVGAEVIFGQARGKTDANGQFALRVRSFDYEPESALMAYIEGFQPAIEERFGVRYEANPEITASLRLGGPALAISGRVVDADGIGQVAVRILLGDGVPFGNQNHSIESVIGGRSMRRVLTDRDGNFTITGLQRRNYIVRAIAEKTLLVLESQPVAAGTTDLVLTAPAEPFYEQLKGQVIDRHGNSIASANVRIMTEVERGHNGYMSTSRPGDHATTDEEGKFVIESCPKRNVYLSVFGDNVVNQRFDLVDQKLPLRIVAKRQLRFRIRSYAGGAGTKFAIHDKNGKQMAFERINVNSNATSYSFKIPTADSPVYRVPEDAMTLVIKHRSKAIAQMPLQLRFGQLNEIDL